MVYECPLCQERIAAVEGYISENANVGNLLKVGNLKIVTCGIEMEDGDQVGIHVEIVCDNPLCKYDKIRTIETDELLTVGMVTG